MIFQLISADPMTVKLFHEFIAVNALIFFPNLKLLLMKSFYEFVAVNSCLFCALNMEFQRDEGYTTDQWCTYPEHMTNENMFS